MKVKLKSKDGFLSKIKNFIKKFRRNEKTLTLPEAIEVESNQQPSNSNGTKSWELSNWEIDKEQYMTQSAENIKKHIEETTQETKSKEVETDKELY